QCGGAKWKGPTTCEDGGKCVMTNEWYAQCEPEAAAEVPAPSPGAVEAKDEKQEQPPPEKTMGPLPSRPKQPAPKTYETLNPIIARGNFLYDSVTGDRFFAKGVAYNPRNEKYDHSFGPSVHVAGWVDKCVPGDPKGGYWGYTADVVSDEKEEFWTEDLEAMANMGANTIRLYNLDPRLSHAKFMKKAASLGIYAIVPLTGKDYGFLPAFPAPECYTKDLEDYGNVGVNLLGFAKTLMKEFSQYNNTLMFTAANELAQLDKNGYSAFPCVKAFVRDLHNYQETYPGDGKADNFQYSPYKDIKQDFEDFSVPFIFSEFGCNLGVFKTKCPYPGGRTWPDVKHFLGEDMGQFMSGAVAFQWSMDKEEYGLTLSPGFLAGQASGL
ncbi:GAS2, partial [Symbiodinium necroappetens]